MRTLFLPGMLERLRKSGAKRLLTLTSTLAIVATLPGQPARPQVVPGQAAVTPQWETAATGKMEFAVASVRPSAPGTPLRVGGLTPFPTADSFKGGLLTANGPLFGYIVFAYKLADMSQYPAVLESLPKWAQTDQFDIEARADGDATTDQMRLMMQSLLKERFKLATHTETRTLPVYALVLDKPGRSGPMLKTHPSDVPCLAKPEAPTPAVPQAPCGIHIAQVGGQMHLTMAGTTMGQVASFLGGAAGYIGGMDNRPVVDETGLSGTFDIDIQFVKDQGPSSEAQTETSGPTFTAALKNQLGLRLVKQAGSTNKLMIDHVEKPSEN